MLWIASCVFETEGLSGKESSKTPSDTGPVSRIPKKLLDLWLAPYDSTTADSLLAGDFAPEAVGAQWEYYRSDRYAKDTSSVQVIERVSRLSQRIVKVDSFTVGKLLTVLRVTQPVRVRYALGGKSLEREEVLDTTLRDSATQLFLERRGGFLVLDSSGAWRVAGSGDAWLYHRVKKSSAVLEAGRYASEKSFSLQVGSTQSKYVSGIGRVSFQAVTVLSGSDSQITAITLMAKDGKVYDDSLWMDWTRRTKPTDSSLLGAALLGLRESLPPGFCTDPSVPSVDTVDERLGAMYQIGLGTTWEYLYKNQADQRTGSWIAGSFTTIKQGSFRITIIATRTMDRCTLFSMEEFLHTVTGIYSSSYLGVKDSSFRTDTDQVYNVLGVQRGAAFCFLNRDSNTYQLLARPPGWNPSQQAGEEGIWWPFPYHADQHAPGDTLRFNFFPPSCTEELANLTVGLHIQDWCHNDLSFPIKIEFRISSRFGLTSYSETQETTVPSPNGNRYLDLFRYNDMVIDSTVFARHQKGL